MFKRLLTRLLPKSAASTLAAGAAVIAVATAAALTPAPAIAQAYPSKPIRIIVPFAAGGTSDILARAIGVKLTESLGQPVIIESRAGANGNVGADTSPSRPLMATPCCSRTWARYRSTRASTRTCRSTR